MPIEELKTYDLFITKINENNVVQEYSVYEEKYNMDIPCIVHLKIECEELSDYANNYKLVDGEMVELTEEEKPIVETQQPTLEDKISILEVENAQLSEYILTLEMQNIELEANTNTNTEYLLQLDERLTEVEINTTNSEVK